MNIKILGTGCTKCHKLGQLVLDVTKELDLDVSIEQVKDIKKISNYSVLLTPGLVIDEEVVCSGRVPSKSEVTQYITNSLAKGT